MSETLKGTVIWWNRDKGYGIADACQEERQILLHSTQITSGQESPGETPYLRGGDIIEFETHQVNQNIAKNIRLARTTPPCSPTSQTGQTPERTQLYDVSTDDEEEY